MLASLVGWLSAFILFLTIAQQVYKQWHDRVTAGISPWLFAGQLAASLGFVVYSWMLANWVFVFTNSMMVATALAGQWVMSRNRAREDSLPQVADGVRPESGSG